MGVRGWSLVVAAVLAPSPASAACKVAKMLDIPITMSGQRPLVTAKFGSRDARFILDSGAFYSTLSRASAAEFGLKAQALPPNFRLKGIGGSTSASSTVAEDFSLRALFDTGAQRSLLSLAAAKRLDVTPASPGVAPAGMSSGLGSRQVPSWIATFDRIDIGGEAIARPRIHIADIDFGNADMLIGADFFLTHRVFVSNATRTMYVTYEGGPMFGLSPRGARTAEGVALDLSDKAGEPTDAEGFGRRGAVFASNGKLKEAIADFDRATAMAPNEGRYFHQRAMARLANRQPLPALADLDRAIALSPTDADARIARAGLRLGGGDQDGAKEDLKAADSALAPSAAQRLTLGGLYDRVEMPEAALTNYTLWLRDRPADSRRATALNGRCWARAQLDRELDAALADCNAALRLMPNRAAYLDSRALVRLRRGELDQALADYDAALKENPRNAWSLYARGLTAARAGRPAEAAANRGAALALDRTVTDRARRIGLEK